jgi:hypothetical protein
VLHRATKLIDSGEVDKAISVLQVATTVHKRSARIWEGLGRALANTGQNREAFAAYRESTWLIARNADVWVSMAELAHQMNKPSDEYFCWKNALRARPQLFRENPSYLTMWEQSEETSKEFAKLVNRLASRDDTSAAIAFLDEVLIPQELTMALRYCRQVAKPIKGALRVVITALDASCLTDGHLEEMNEIAELRNAASELVVSDEALSAVIQTVARLTQEQWTQYVHQTSEQADLRVLRASYAASDHGSLAALHAVTSLSRRLRLLLVEVEQAA